MVAEVKRKPGRPPGSGNKNKKSEQKTPKRRPGRPPGSGNKKTQNAAAAVAVARIAVGDGGESTRAHSRERLLKLADEADAQDQAMELARTALAKEEYSRKTREWLGSFVTPQNLMILVQVILLGLFWCYIIYTEDLYKSRFVKTDDDSDSSGEEAVTVETDATMPETAQTENSTNAFLLQNASGVTIADLDNSSRDEATPPSQSTTQNLKPLDTGITIVDASEVLDDDFYATGLEVSTSIGTLSLEAALAADTCSSLTREQALAFLCRRGILAPLHVMRSNVACLAFVSSSEACPAFRRCIRNIVNTHFTEDVPSTNLDQVLRRWMGFSYSSTKVVNFRPSLCEAGGDD